MDDLSCYRDYLSGNDEALGILVERYNCKLIYFLNSYTHNPYDSEDLAADTFLTLIMKKPVFKEKSSFKTWLYKIARNKALDLIRKNKVRESENIDEYSDISSDELIEKSYVKMENADMLYKAMDKLHLDYCTVLKLMYFEGFDTNEICKIMNKNVKQVNNLTYRAKQALKEELLKAGFVYENE